MSTSTPIQTELKETFTPNSTIRKRMEALAASERLSSSTDPMQLRVFTDDAGRAIHMGVVAAEDIHKIPSVVVDVQKELILKSPRHRLALKAEDILMPLFEKLKGWVESHRSHRESVYRSSYSLS